jgi:hypothetical protein
VTSGFVLLSFVLSLKKYNPLSSLVLYSKSNLTNKNIYRRYFLGRAFINNTLLLLFNLIVLKGIIKVEYFIGLPIITVLSIVFSFVIMLAKNSYINKKISMAKTNRLNVNPVVKSTFHDYFTFDFFQAAAITFALCIVLLIEIIKTGNTLYGTENLHLVFMGLIAILSIGFMGIIDSIPQANWKFYAVIMPCGFKYHLKRSFLFLISVYALPIAAFLFSGLLLSVPLTIKYLYCLIVILCISIGMGFTTGNMFIKIIVMLFITVLTLWLSTMPVYFLVLPAILGFILMLKARSEYMERYYL